MEKKLVEAARLIRQERDTGGTKIAARLQPTFHENQGKSCLDVPRDLKRYCLTGTDSPRRAVKILNEESPAGIPDEFRWAFDNLEESGQRFHSIRRGNWRKKHSDISSGKGYGVVV